MTDPIRVTHVITDLDTGGAEMMLYKLLSGMDREAFLPSVISLTDIGPVGQRIAALGIEVSALGMTAGGMNPASFFQLRDRLRASHPDVVQTWMYHADLLGGAATRLAGNIPVVWNIRNSTLDVKTSKRSTRMVVDLNARLSYFLPRAVIVCSEQARAVHVGLGYAAGKMRVIPNGFNLSEFMPAPEARIWLRGQLDLPGDTPLIGLVARFDPQKDLQTFVHAARVISQDRPEVHYIFCGDRLDHENEILTGWIREAGLTDRFHLLGRRSDIARVTAGFDLAVSSSAYGEAFSNVIGEAMACEVPCVATDVGDAALIVADTGRVVPPRDPNRLAEAVLIILNLSEDERKEMGRKARERILQNYDLSQIANAYIKVYREVLS